MRKQFINTVSNVFDKDDKTVLLLGDIGVFGFKPLSEKYPNRVYNVGILEQSMIGMASGLSMTNMIPIVHTIAPFLVERCYEQLKIDFGYQHLCGNFVSIGASYDYASLGATHHCPADINVLRNIPNMEIVVCGSAYEFDRLFNQSYNNGNPTYFRLSDYSNKNVQEVEFGKANVIKKGNKATVVVVGNLLDTIIEACFDEDVTILYYTTISPFDYEALQNNCNSNKILLCEPYYYGGLVCDIFKYIKKPLRIECVGMPYEFLNNYGSKAEHDQALGFTVENIKLRLEKLLNE